MAASSCTGISKLALAAIARQTIMTSSQTVYEHRQLPVPNGETAL